jgi:hypothetical protein
MGGEILAWVWNLQLLKKDFAQWSLLLSSFVFAIPFPVFHFFMILISLNV